MYASLKGCAAGRTILDSVGLVTMVRWSSLCLCMIVLMAGLTCPSGARSAGIFDVTVAVDVTAETATRARERALAEGQTRAFSRLVERLTLAHERGRVPDSGRDRLQGLVQDIAVANERTSSVRYLADLTVRFRPDAVRAFLRDLGVSYSETSSKPVVVLPVYQASGTLQLFDDPNPWRTAWSAVAAGYDGLVPLILPTGDLADIAVIGPELALRGDQSALSAIAQRYRANDVLVVHAVQSVAGQGRFVLDVQAVRYGSGQQEQGFVQSYEQRAEETVEQLLARAAGDLAARVQDQWKRATLVNFGEAAVLPVRIPVTGLADWLAVRKQLAATSAVRRIEVVLLSRTEVRVNVHYVGGPEQLSLALRQADLVLSGSAGDNVLSMTPSRSPG
jgi:hypothetical protein